MLYFVAKEALTSVAFAFCDSVKFMPPSAVSKTEELSFPAKVTFIASIALSKADELGFVLRAL